MCILISDLGQVTILVEPRCDTVVLRRQRPDILGIIVFALQCILKLFFSLKLPAALLFKLLATKFFLYLTLSFFFLGDHSRHKVVKFLIGCLPLFPELIGSCLIFFYTSLKLDKQCSIFFVQLFKLRFLGVYLCRSLIDLGTARLDLRFLFVQLNASIVHALHKTRVVAYHARNTLYACQKVAEVLCAEQYGNVACGAFLVGHTQEPAEILIALFVLRLKSLRLLAAAFKFLLKSGTLRHKKIELFGVDIMHAVIKLFARKCISF